MILPCLRDHIRIPPIFGVIPIQPFGILVGIGLVVGYTIARRRAAKTGLDADLCADGMVWTVVVGFIVAHITSVVFYFPERILENPLVLLAFWSGLSSFGGFVGGAVGAYWFFKHKNNVSLLKYADAIIFGLLPGWVFGRMGCTVVHDHPGKPVTDFFLTVACDGASRYDLGLLEMLYSVVLTAILFALKNVRPFHGFHPALMILLYAPVRFVLDYARTADERYVGLTPGQYFSVGLFAFGILLIRHGLKLRAAGDYPKKPAPA